MFDFLSTAGLCKKSHRFAAFVVACITLIVVVVVLCHFANNIVDKLSQYSEIIINLFDLIIIEAK